MTAALNGVRVIDLTMVWAGPFGTRALGDFGAEIIKVESPTQWDMLRSLGLIPREVDHWYDMSAYFNHNNRNKYGLALDLRQAAGRELLLRLAAISDVIVENYRADVMDQLGLGYDVVRAANPRIVYVSMPGHGKTGPEAGYIAYGSNVEQLAGLVSVSGYEGDEPLKTGFSYGDPMAGTALVGAVAMALRHRNRTDEGTYVELAQRENLGMFVGEFVVDYSMNGELRAPIGNRHPHIAPYNRYPSGGEDRWVAIACEDDAQFAGLCQAMQRPELLEDPRFTTNALRKEHEEALDAIIAEWTAARGHYEAMHVLQRFGVAAGAVLTTPEVMADPQLRSRGAWVSHTHPYAGTWEVEAPVWKLPRTPAHVRMPAPAFGQHNRYVLGDLLGLDETAIAALYAAGVTADVPDVSLHQ